MFHYKTLYLFLAVFLYATSIYAIEIAPRISDREIITALTELKMGQKSLEKQFIQMGNSMNQRLEQMQRTMDKRLEQMQRTMDKRLEQMQKSNNGRFDQVNQHFEQVNQRFDQMQKLISENSAQINRRFTFLENLILVMITAILGLVGFVIWDRKTALRPLEKKLDKLEQDLQHDLELQSPEGSRLTRMIHAFRELAQQDPQVKRTLQSFSLL